jgi:hypothetical protein
MRYAELNHKAQLDARKYVRKPGLGSPWAGFAGWHPRARESKAAGVCRTDTVSKTLRDLGAGGGPRRAGAAPEAVQAGGVPPDPVPSISTRSQARA